DANVDRLMHPDYGPSSFAGFAADRTGASFETDDFRKTDFAEACSLARERAVQNVPAILLDMMEENLSTDMEESEWQWQAMARQLSGRFDLKLTDRDLKRIGRDNLAEQIQS